MNKLVLALFFSLPASGQETIVFKPAENLTVSNVSAIKLYAYDINKGCDRATPVSLIDNDKVTPCSRYVKTFEKEKVKQIIKLLRSEATYGGEPAACFETNYSLMMLDKANVVIGYVDISLFCNRLIANPLIPETGKKNGFSKKGKELLLHTLELVSEEDIVAP
ncbi:hypothetical protein [Chitinophaga niabensis]|uniref:Uncharacterized protein n=1 Tax=Chitinophaga niabensis TaxID=536979 RepID=A0A1N6EV12_9BACT|nr:hypothetical protein [Chitinophaga niabensis]SIN86804.1 hypothetical protein SAMN04488055_1845 [Chitinophaga niabensis]